MIDLSQYLDPTELRMSVFDAIADKLSSSKYHDALKTNKIGDMAERLITETTAEYYSSLDKVPTLNEEVQESLDSLISVPKVLLLVVHAKNSIK